MVIFQEIYSPSEPPQYGHPNINIVYKESKHVKKEHKSKYQSFSQKGCYSSSNSTTQHRILDLTLGLPW